MAENEIPETFAEQLVYDLLRATDAPPQVAAVFGDRVYPVTIPQDVQLPALYYSQLEENIVETKDGNVANGYRFETVLAAHDFGTLKKGVRAVRGALNGKLWPLPGSGDLYVNFIDESEPEYDADREVTTIALRFKAT